jgi:hypothetical protein
MIRYPCHAHEAFCRAAASALGHHARSSNMVCAACDADSRLQLAASSKLGNLTPTKTKGGRCSCKAYKSVWMPSSEAMDERRRAA